MKKQASIPFPGWEVLREQAHENEPQVLLLVKDESGQPIRWIEGAEALGVHRASWDLRLPAPHAINLIKPAFKPPWAGDPKGPLVAPRQVYRHPLHHPSRGDGGTREPTAF